MATKKKATSPDIPLTSPVTAAALAGANLLNDEQRAEILALFATAPLEAVRRVRTITGLELGPAKLLAEQLAGTIVEGELVELEAATAPTTVAASPAEPAPPVTEAPAEPAPVVVTFPRPPLPVEMEVRRFAADPEQLVTAIRAYQAWANTGLEPGDPARTGLMAAQEAVYWLCAQAIPTPEPEPAADHTDGAPRLRIVPPPADPDKVVATIIPPPRTKVLAERDIDHEFTLNDMEVLDMGRRLADIQGEIEAEEARQAEAKRKMKATMSALEGEQGRLASVVRKRKEVRRVHVAVVADYHDGVARDVVEGTGEVLGERQLDAHERQLTMFARGPKVEPAPVEPSEAAPPVEVVPDVDPDTEDADDDEDDSE